jgi:hypothetical protein
LPKALPIPKRPWSHGRRELTSALRLTLQLQLPFD